MKCSDIERKFQSNPKSSFTFNIGSETLEIKFRGGARSQKSLHMQHSSCTTSFVSFSDTSLIFFFSFVRNEAGGEKKKEESHSTAVLPTAAGSSRVSLDFGFFSLVSFFPRVIVECTFFLFIFSCRWGWPACIFTAITTTSSVNCLYLHCAALLLSMYGQIKSNQSYSNCSVGFTNFVQ